MSNGIGTENTKWQAGRKPASRVMVDSGVLLVCDPGYLEKWMGDQFSEFYDLVLAAAVSTGRGATEIVIEPLVTAVVLSGLGGDGIYHVETTEEGARIIGP